MRVLNMEHLMLLTDFELECSHHRKLRLHVWISTLAFHCFLVTISNSVCPVALYLVKQNEASIDVFSGTPGGALPIPTSHCMANVIMNPL